MIEQWFIISWMTMRQDFDQGIECRHWWRRSHPCFPPNLHLKKHASEQVIDDAEEDLRYWCLRDNAVVV
jgi:hypothetical protein